MVECIGFEFKFDLNSNSMISVGDKKKEEGKPKIPKPNPAHQPKPAQPSSLSFPAAQPATHSPPRPTFPFPGPLLSFPGGPVRAARFPLLPFRSQGTSSRTARASLPLTTGPRASAAPFPRARPAPTHSISPRACISDRPARARKPVAAALFRSPARAC